MIETQKPYLNRKQASDLLCRQGFPITCATLAKFASVGGGPPMHFFGRKPLYDPDETLDWARTRTTKKFSTSDVGERNPKRQPMTENGTRGPDTGEA
jgi:hypothetical protein